jgi:hypothetical protein
MKLLRSASSPDGHRWQIDASGSVQALIGYDYAIDDEYQAAPAAV